MSISAVITGETVGLTFNDALVVIEAPPSSAATRAGVIVGDVLETINGAAASGLGGIRAVLSALRSAPRPLRLTFVRAAGSRPSAVSARGGRAGAGSGGGETASSVADAELALLLLPTLRQLSALMLGMAIFCIVSGGLVVVSSALIIALALQLRRLAASPTALAAARQREREREEDESGGGGHRESEAAAAAADGCECIDAECTACCNSPLAYLRALAIAGMVVSIVEVLLIGFLLAATGDTFARSICYYSGGYNNDRMSTSLWMLYASGNSIIASTLNLAMSVSTFSLARAYKKLGPKAASARERLPLLAAYARGGGGGGGGDGGSYQALAPSEPQPHRPVDVVTASDPAPAEQRTA